MKKFEIVYEYTDESGKKQTGNIICKDESKAAFWLKLIRDEEGARLLKINEVEC